MKSSLTSHRQAEPPTMEDLPRSFERGNCGCCGRRLEELPRLWCQDCINHVSMDRKKPPYDRTYEALFGYACPFQHKEQP